MLFRCCEMPPLPRPCANISLVQTTLGNVSVFFCTMILVVHFLLVMTGFDFVLSDALELGCKMAKICVKEAQ